MSRDGCVALPHGAMGLSVVCDCVVFPDHTHYFCFVIMSLEKGELFALL